MRNKLGMGDWKARIIRKKGKASRTASTPARLYIAIPPIEGWRGGHPSDNGLRAGRK